MKRLTNPLDGIRIASPCSANWDEMHGSQRRRFCTLCNLNVYDLSEMTRTEAESFLINAEGRTCIKFYRRRDGTVLTSDCSVGVDRIRKRRTRWAAAFLALIGSFSSGITVFRAYTALIDLVTFEKAKEPIERDGEGVSFGIYGSMINLAEIKQRLIDR